MSVRRDPMGGPAGWQRALLAILAVSVLSADQRSVTAQAPARSQVFLPAVLMKEERIAFLSSRDGAWGLYTVRPDGSGLRHLAPASSESGAEPRWSPDRTQIAFGCADGRDICVVWANGSGLRRLTTSAAGEHSPSWSADGESIAFVSEADGNSEILVVDVEGSALTNLTNSPAADAEPHWSPDGALIAFTSDRSGSSAIYTMRPDGTDLRQITTGEDSSPAWSPDGGRVVFSRGDDICLVDRDGRTETKISQWYFHSPPLHWSPDGAAIAFRTFGPPAKCSWIAILREAGPDAEWMGDVVGECVWIDFHHSPAWSPDSTAIAYVEGDSGDIRIVGRDGIDRNVTNQPENRTALAWATR